MQKGILRLIKAANLSRGTDNFVHSTKLMPIVRLYNRNKSICSDFYPYLLRKSFENFDKGKSLAKSNLVSDEEKRAIYEEVLFDINKFHVNREEKQIREKLEKRYEYFQQLSLGWKRLYVHASRRKMEDPDLILMEDIIRAYLKNWHTGCWAYFLCQYYCCDYKDLRFKMNTDSASRIMDIAYYFINKYNEMNIEAGCNI